MSFKIQAAALLGALASSVSAHGHVSGAVVDGTYYQGYDPSFQYQATPPEVIGWSCPECLDNGFVDPTMYSDVTKIACHKDATAGKAVAKVKAGGKVVLQWTTWPESHVGPVLDYLAKVDDATAATAKELSFFKIDQDGYDNGDWAASKLVANNNSWTVTIPSSIAAGQYVLRHEIIALHSAGQENGAQNYPQCINIEVTGGGTESPTGETADKFYTATDPGIKVDIYSGLNSYEIPGPALFDGASSASGSDSNASQAPAASSVAATSATASPAATSSVSVAANAQSIPTPVATEAPVPTGAVEPFISQIASISTAIPSSLITGVIPTAAPTAGANFSGPQPENPIPEGVTIKDLLEWLSYAMRNFFGKDGRRHSREF